MFFLLYEKDILHNTKSENKIFFIFVELAASMHYVISTWLSLGMSRKAYWSS